MDKKEQVKLVKSLQKTVEQMKIDDMEESPDSAYDLFTCDCCGEDKIVAGSLPYDEYILCNDCVLLAETGFALNKIKEIQDLINSMEEKRFETMYKSVFEENENENN